MKSLQDSAMNELNEGITYNSDTNQFMFNYDKNHESDIIQFNSTPIKKLALGHNLDDVFTFGYEFTSNASSKVRTEFFNQFRFSNTFTSKDNKDTFILNAISKFHKEFNLSTFSTIVYPDSRSIINREIIKHISKFFRVDLNEFELIKKLPKDITFDMKRYTKEVLDDMYVKNGKEFPRYTESQKLEAISKIDRQLTDIHNSNYFSIAGSVQSNKLKPYFSEFLQFKTKDEELAYKAITNGDILIIDDVTTTGSTIIEIIKTLRTLNSTNKIIVFTIVGKSSFQ